MVNNDTLTENLYSLTDSNDWSAQLNKIINDPPSLMINSNITLLNYKELGKVENSNDEVMYREMLKSNENMFPIYSKDLLAIRAVHKNEAVNLDSEHQKFTNKKGNYFLDNLTLRGGKILVLKWNNNGVEQNTICAVSDKEGILYDNLISNTFIIKDPIISSTTSSATLPRLKSSSEGSTYPPGTYDWTLHHEAYWLWGSGRGEVIINHQGIFNNNGFVSHNFLATHHMTVGNSDAKVKAVNNRTIAYGYGMSTPFISITLSYANGHYTLNFSSTLGSTMGGTGQHTF
jgi:hypothetical protein